MATKLASIQLDFRYWDFPELKNIRYAGIPWEEHKITVGLLVLNAIILVKS